LRILVSWLRDFVDVPVGPGDLAGMLGMRGFEVAAVEEPPEGPLAPETPALRPRRSSQDEPSNEGGSAGPDAVIDLEITANRPDCLSVIGIAREVSTAYDLPLRTPDEGHAGQPSLGASAQAEDFSVTIEDPDLCPRYVAAMADVKVGPSPAWLANRLVAGGVRPINNVVDVTNYVLLETGHPLHAFDVDRLGGRQLRIRRSRAGETIRTLDGNDRKLDADMLVIADAARPQAIAGVRGGADSEVWGGTRRIVFESAYFKPVSVRRTSKRLGLKTEASSRFERGADINAPVVAMSRACALVASIGAGHAVGPILDCYPLPRGPVTVTLRRTRIAHLLGQAIDDRTVVRVLTRLGFRVEPAEPGWVVTAPTWRVDVAREVDLIEELARHYGYDRLPTTFPPLTTFTAPQEAPLEQKRALRRILTAAGFSEAVTLAFIEQAAASPFADGSSIVPIAYPLSEKFAVLRPSLLPGLVDAIGHNRRREQHDVRLFEIGAHFSVETGERWAIAFGWTGAAAPEHWSGTGRVVDFFDAKGVVERILEASGVAARFAPASATYLLDGRAADVVSASGSHALGVVGQLQPALAEARGLPAGDVVYVAELDLASLLSAGLAAEVTFGPLPRHPSVVRDLSVIVDETLPAEAVRGTISAAAPSTLTGVGEFDRYHGKGIPEGRVSLSFRLTFRAPDRTLTDVEVDRAMETVVAALVEKHQAVRR
jgi:phenylalanyl-tRNA synthetase beta chain